MKLTTSPSAIAALSAAFVLVSALSAEAATITSTGIRAGGAFHARDASTTAMMQERRQERMASTTAARQERLQQRLEKASERGATEIDKRVESLNDLLSRIQGMKNVSDADKLSFQTSIQAEIADLQALKASIASSSASMSTSTLKTELLSITQGNRVYALVEPRARILAAADRINTIASMMSTISVKLQDRYASSTASTTASSPSVSSYLSEINAKIADAQAQAQAAISEITPLKADNGDKTIAASNAAALKDARLKVEAAQKDLVTARQDIDKIVRPALREMNKESKTGQKS